MMKVSGIKFKTMYFYMTAAAVDWISNGEGFTCGNGNIGQFQCSDETACITARKFCDGKKDCPDGSDEPALRNNSITYEANTNFCRGTGQYSDSRYPRILVYSICVLPPSLEAYKDELCQGSTCRDGEFSCSDGSQCVPKQNFCDGKPDCDDGSDEPPLRNYTASYNHHDTYCRGKSRSGSGRYVCLLPSSLLSQSAQLCDGSSCSASEFTCSDGSKCIAGEDYCDRYADCLDGSDEPPLRNSSVTYGDDVIFCRSHRTTHISSYSVCVLPPDHVPYVEKLCAGTTCRHDEFPCLDGSTCLWNRYFCDSDPQCRDGSDEQYFDSSMVYNSNVSFCRKAHPDSSRICMLPERTPVDGYTFCEGSACHWNELSCDSGSTCIEKRNFCDGRSECRDGSDEPWRKSENIDINATLCRKKTDSFQYSLCELPAGLVPYHDEMCDGSSCQPGEFSCANGRMCVPQNQYCNGITDCKDGSDEINQSEMANFTGRICHRNGRQCMISDSNLCDGVPLCDHNIDECICPGDGKYRSDSKCFQCLTEPFVVLPIPKLCDGVFDCPDLTDECLCQETTRPKLCENVMFATGVTGKSNLLSIRCEGNGTTVQNNVTSVCDNRLDCLQMEDEAHCIHEEPRDNAFQRNKTLDYECGDPVGRNATKCDGIPECDSFVDEECHCETAPEFCESMDVYGYQYTLFEEYSGFLYGTCLHYDTGQQLHLSLDMMCDGTVICDNHSDERGCNSRFYCTDEPTPNIPIEKKCDKQADCDNGADEEGCPHFNCEDEGALQYISLDSVCDGIKDCKSGLDECQPGCIDSAFSDEKLMITSKAILALSWIISLGAMIGCTAVIVITLWSAIKPFLSDNVAKSSTRTNLINRLILSLSVSDLLVGIYAFSISLKASKIDTDYCQIDRAWRSSSTCSALGAIMVIGSEQSVFTMVIIASHRLYSVMRPFSRPHVAVTTMTVFISWFVSILLGIIPLIPHIEDYFVSSISLTEHRLFKVLKYQDIRYMDKWLSLIRTTTHPQYESTDWNRLKNMILNINPNMTVAYEFGYYSSHGVCLPTFFPDPSVDRAWGYSFFLLLLNFVAFLYMLVCYVLLFRHAMVTSTAIEANASEEINNKENKRLQRKLTRIVISDFLCWIPICIIGFLSFNGVDIPKDVYLPAGLLVVPINSALNPLLYSDLPEIIWIKMMRIIRPSPASAPDQTEAVEMTET